MLGLVVVGGLVVVAQQVLEHPAPILGLPDYNNDATTPVPDVAAGQPLETSHADIQVLADNGEATPLETVPASETTSITVLENQQPATHTYPVTPQPNLTPLRLAVTLDLLHNALMQGSPQGHTLAATAQQLAVALNDDALTKPLTVLAQTLPETGAPTLANLVANAQALQTEATPTQPTAPVNQAPAWLAPFVTIRPAVTSQPQPDITPSLVAPALLEGNVAEALNLLQTPGLESNPQAIALRAEVELYQSLHTAIEDALTAIQPHLSESPTP